MEIYFLYLEFQKKKQFIVMKMDIFQYMIVTDMDLITPTLYGMNQLLILSTGQKPKLLSDAEIERVRRKMSGYGLKDRKDEIVD